MKINLLAAHRDLARVLETPHFAGVDDPFQASKFGQLLADISPSIVTKKPVISEDYKYSLKIPAGLEESLAPGPMARFKFPEPQAVAPIVERIVPSEKDTGFVNEVASSVKTSSAAEVVSAAQMPSARRGDEPGSVHGLVRSAGIRHGVDPLLGLAVAEVESHFDPNAVSQDGHRSKGLFQLLDSTGEHLLQQSGSNQRYDPFNPEMNVDLGVGYLRYLHDLFSKDSLLPNNLSTRAAANSASLEKLAVAAFNAGEGRVAAAQERAGRDGKNATEYAEVEPYLPESTQEYVQRIEAAKQRFEGTSIG